MVYGKWTALLLFDSWTFEDFQSFAACKIYSTFQKWTKNIEKNWEEIAYKIPYKWKCLIFSCNFLRLQKKISFFRENTPKIRIIC